MMVPTWITDHNGLRVRLGPGLRLLKVLWARLRLFRSITVVLSPI